MPNKESGGNGNIPAEIESIIQDEFRDGSEIDRHHRDMIERLFRRNLSGQTSKGSEKAAAEAKKILDIVGEMQAIAASRKDPKVIPFSRLKGHEDRIKTPDARLAELTEQFHESYALLPEITRTYVNARLPGPTVIQRLMAK